MSIVLKRKELRDLLEFRTERELARVFHAGKDAWRVMSFKGKPSWVSGPYVTRVHEAHGELHLLFEERDGPGMAIPFAMLLDAEPFTVFTSLQAAQRYLSRAAEVFTSDAEWQAEHKRRMDEFHRALQEAGLIDRTYAAAAVH